MGRTDDIRAWVITGALGSMALGVALIPLRTIVSASNLAFVFLAFTIVVAELGGRTPALVLPLSGHGPGCPLLTPPSSQRKLCETLFGIAEQRPSPTRILRRR